MENLRELTSKKDLIAAEPRCQKRVQNAHEVDEPIGGRVVERCIDAAAERGKVDHLVAKETGKDEGNFAQHQ